MSNNLDISITDFGKICRTCLSTENLKPLYEKCFSSICLVDMLMSCTIITFKEDDGLPLKICANCINDINLAFSFAKRCETADTILRKCLQKVKPIFRTDEDIILPQMYRTIKEVLGDYNYVGEVKQEELIIENEYDEIDDDFAYESYEKNADELLYNEKFETPSSTYDDPADEKYSESYENNVYEDQDELLYPEKSENPSSTYDDPADEKYEKDVEENSEKLENPVSTFFPKQEESSNDEDGFLTAKINPYKIESIPRSYYECNKCFENFLDFKALKKHRRNKHPQKNVLSSCTICNKLIGIFAMKHHMETHTGEKPYRCELCGAGFIQGWTLRRHKRFRHSTNFQRKKGWQKCQTCQRSFKRLHLLKAHEKIHTEKENVNHSNQILSRDFQCTECDRTFKTKILLQEHSAIHGEMKFLSSVCRKEFSKTRQHSDSKIHKDDIWPYTCNVCGKAFRQLKILQNHKLIHNNDKKVCFVCNKVFASIVGLNCHMRIHNAMKLYKCAICSKSFRYPKGYKTHMNRKHPGEKPFTCVTCNKTFAYFTRFQEHMKKHHPEVKPSTQSNSLKSSRRVHSSGVKPSNQSNSLKSPNKICTAVKSYTCKVCDKTFIYQRRFNSHMKIHYKEPKPYTQSDCLKSPIRIPTGEKKYSCGACGKIYSTQGNFNVHKRSNKHKINLKKVTTNRI